MISKKEEAVEDVEEEKSAVDHPAHYNAGGIEVIEAIDEWGFGVGFCAGNIIKYVARHEHKKDRVEDLKKARWYLDHLILLCSIEEEVGEEGT